MSEAVKRCASAPGKLVLIGEYAVACGLPALSMAISRRAKACLQPATDHYHRLTSSLDEHRTYRLSVTGQIRNWIDTPPAPIERFASRLPWPNNSSTRPGIHLSLGSKNFYSGNKKLGIGSSAALLLAAGSVFQTNSKNLRERHDQFQGQAGSGVDLATSRHGGLICYQQTKPVIPMRLPENFHWRAVWSGSSAGTADFLRAFKHWRARRPGRWHEFRRRAAMLISEAINATAGNRAGSLCACLRAYGEWLRELGREIQKPVYTQEFDHLRALSQDAGCAFKPSGAGGGDIGLVCADSERKLTEFCQTITGTGITILDLQLEPAGLEVTGHESV